MVENGIIDVHLPIIIKPGGEEFNYGACRELAEEVNRRGSKVVFSGTSAYDLFLQTVQIMQPKFPRSGKLPAVPEVVQRVVELEDIVAVRNVATIIGGGVPELNHPDVRKLTGDKAKTNQMLETVQLAKPYVVYTRGGDIDEAFDRMPSDHVVVKPRFGSRSEHLLVGTKNSVRNKWMREMDQVEDWLVEEQLFFAPRLPLLANSAAYQDQLDYVNRNNQPKELRAFYFGRDDSGELVTNYVLKAHIPNSPVRGRNTYIGIDEDSIPQEVTTIVENVYSLIENNTNVREVHGCVDLSYVISATYQYPTWVTIELNSKPGIFEAYIDRAATYKQTGMLADQLCRVAERRSTL